MPGVLMGVLVIQALYPLSLLLTLGLGLLLSQLGSQSQITTSTFKCVLMVGVLPGQIHFRKPHPTLPVC